MEENRFKLFSNENQLKLISSKLDDCYDNIITQYLNNKNFDKEKFDTMIKNCSGLEKDVSLLQNSHKEIIEKIAEFN